MNKEMFLEELREYLRILEDQEQEDILEEYAQHIDMKLQKGLSEEEAISDFGPVKELAAKILEAYHVKPEFREKTTLAILPGIGRSAAKSKNFFKRTGRYLKEKIMAMCRSIRRGGQWTKEKCKSFWDWAVNPIRKRKKERTASWDEGTQTAGEVKDNEDATERKKPSALSLPGKQAAEKGEKTDTKRGTEKMKNFFRMTGHGVAALCGIFWAFCRWWLRFFWNAAWLLFSLFCAAMALIVLMGIGTMLVFLIQGYPILGLFLICLGGLLCLGAMSAGAFSLLIRREKEENKQNTGIGGMEKHEGEVQYE